MPSVVLYVETYQKLDIMKGNDGFYVMHLNTWYGPFANLEVAKCAIRSLHENHAYIN